LVSKNGYVSWELFVGLVRRLAKGGEGDEEEKTKRDNMKMERRRRTPKTRKRIKGTKNCISSEASEEAIK